MIYEMKLQDKFYNYILNGTKRIELRLNDLKRQQIRVGDKIKFFNIQGNDEWFIVEVIGLLNYSNFNDLLNDFEINIFADVSMSKDELLDILEEFYSIDEQQKFGILGIRFEVIR